MNPANSEKNKGELKIVGNEETATFPVDGELTQVNWKDAT
jgi:hypothetical protein